MSASITRRIKRSTIQHPQRKRGVANQGKRSSRHLIRQKGG